MAQIRLKINGRDRNVNLAKMDWAKAERLNTEYGTTPTDSDNINSVYDCIMQTTLNGAAVPTGADNKMYIFRSTHSSGSLISDLVPLREQLGTRVVYFGARQKTGDDMVEFFDSPASLGIDDAPASTDLDLHDPEQIVYSQVSGLSPYTQAMVWRTGPDTSALLANMNAAAYIETTTGGKFGVSLCSNVTSAGTSVIVWSFGKSSYHDNSGSYSVRGNYWSGWGSTIGWYPSFGGVDVLTGVPFINCWSATAMNNSFGDNGHTLQDDISAEMIYTEINGKPYLGMAACKWTGDFITEVDVVFLPAWFWGQYEEPTDPSDIPQYHGFDGTPQRQSGSYSYTPNDIEMASTPVQPVSGVSDTDFGLHVYRISDADYANIQSTLWGKGSLADALWNRWNNYKFNPVAGVLGCHVLPKAFMPDVTGMSYSQPRAAGGALETTGQAYHVNGQTTITATAASVSMPEYFSSHLNWDPYTSVQLFLPFCGWISIPADRCIDTKEDGSTGSISIQYRCDIITGNVCCFVRCFNADGVNTFSTQVTGNAALSVPITGNDNGTGQILGAITAAAGVAVGALTGGIGTAAMVAGAAGAGLAVNTAKHTLQNGSTYSGNVASLGCLQPYLLITMPIEHTSEQWRYLHGLPSGLGLTVGDLTGTGYTELSEFHAEIDCISPEEQQEIENLMMGGVIL